MTLRPLTILEIAGAILLVVVGAIAIHEHDASVREQAVADATKQAQGEIIKQATDSIQKSQTQIDQLTKLVQQSEADKAVLQAQINKKYQQVQTPVQAATVTAQSLGVAPSEVKTGGTAQNPTLEAPQKPLLDYQQACDTCQLNLKVSTQQLTYSEQIRQQQTDQLSKKDQTIGALGKELDTQTAAAKGGTWKQRTWHDTKVGIIGGGIAILVACALGHCPH